MLSSLVAVALLATLIAAQAPTTNFSSSEVNAVLGEVPLGTLNSWCSGQITTCGTLCGGNAFTNTCSGANLNYTCTCASNSSAPAEQYYANTVISNICNRVKGDCLATRAGDLSGQKQCSVMYVCGNATASQAAVAGAATTSSSATTAGPTVAASGTSGSASATPSTTKAAAAVKIGQEYGVVILSAGLLALMGLAL